MKWLRLITLIPVTLIILALFIPWWSLTALGTINGFLIIKPDVIDPIQGIPDLESFIPILFGGLAPIISIGLTIMWWTSLLAVILVIYKGFLGRLGWVRWLLLYIHLLFFLLCCLFYHQYLVYHFLREAL